MLLHLLLTTALVQALGLDVTLSTSKPKFTAIEPVLVRVTMRNPLSTATRILTWVSAVNNSRIFDSLFNITVGSGTVKYIGPVGKVLGSFITINANSALTGIVDLTELYDFSVTGTYRIKYQVDGRGLFDPADTTVQSLSSNTLTLTVEGRINQAAAARAQPAPTLMAASSSFNGCTAARQTAVIAARGSAQTMAVEADSYMKAQPYSGSLARYIKWFGSTGTYYGSVTNHFTTILNVLNNGAISFDCSTCTNAGLFAYVYTNSPYTIYLCPGFWGAAQTGTDSKAGTIIHELSHFTVVAGTADHAYGQALAASLAISNPASAAANADSHEYFSENTPFIPRPAGGTVNWQVGPDGNWAMSCDFKTRDLTPVKSTGATCSTACKNTKGCTHYTWTSFNGGTCWTKQGPVVQSDAFVIADKAAVCGINSAIAWQGKWAYGCDFKAQDLKSSATLNTACGTACQATAGCTHYTWSNFNGGTCWMKQGPATKLTAFATGDNTMVCGLL